VADAIRDHYKPQGPADTVPTAPLTVAVALADKLDTLVGFFAIDEKPTGSKDPFALRRAALGVIRLMLENRANSHLHSLINAHAERLTEQLVRTTVRGVSEMFIGKDGAPSIGRKASEEITVDNARVTVRRWPRATTEFSAEANAFARDLRNSMRVRVELELLPFIHDRLRVFLRENGKRFDLVNAVLDGGADNLVRLVWKLEALDAFLSTDDGANLLAGYKRASNILKAEEKKGPLPTGAVATGQPNQPEAETALAFAAEAARIAVDAALETEDFAAAMTALAALRAPVDAFFTDVMVNSEVPAERENRLKLLGQVRAVMGRVADFGVIAG